MKVLLFGGTGMVGRGVLRECLRDPDVESVLAVGRSAVGVLDPKLVDLAVPDLFDVAAYADRLTGYDACFFCLGVSSAGMNELAYTRITYDLTMAVARALPHDIAFVYVSGAGTDANGRSMWARVKGRTEDDLMALLPRAYALRPGFIQPRHGERSRTMWYRVAYAVASPLFPVVRRLGSGAVTSTDVVGRAMLRLARDGWPERVLETRAINAAGAGDG
jgi:uncharacterized protein YbjT (DUF2867 family)